MAWSVRTLELSRFALDGGAMHGIIPKPLWSRHHAADGDNRIALVARALLLEEPALGLRVLCEAGLGARWSDKERRMYRIDSAPLPAALRALGVDPDGLTHVICTHLHWDHAGGLCIAGEAAGTSALALPRAEHVVSEASLRHAALPSDKDAGSFRRDDLAALTASPRLRLWRPDEPLLPGLEARLSFGHTPGLMLVTVRARADGPPLAFPTDLVPTASHLALRWVMAYDNDPLCVIEEKRALYAELERSGGGLVLYHDPVHEAAWPASSSGNAAERRWQPGPLGGPAC